MTSTCEILQFKDIETLNNKAAYKRNKPIFLASDMPKPLEMTIKPAEFGVGRDPKTSDPVSLRERLQLEWGLTGEKLDNEHRMLKALEERLLSFGGNNVMFEVLDGDTPRILERGQFWYNDKVSWMPHRASQCHKNSCDLWVANKDHTTIATGYALSNDGLWRCHSWVIKFNAKSARVVETTPCKRSAYFGYAMMPDECERFDAANL